MRALIFILLVSFVVMPIMSSMDGVQAGDPKGALFQNYERSYPLYNDPLMSPNGIPYNP